MKARLSVIVSRRGVTSCRLGLLLLGVLVCIYGIGLLRGGTLTLSGQVLDDSGRGVPFATVFICKRTDDSLIRQIFSDENGGFVFDAVPRTKQLCLWAEKEGMVGFRRREYDVAGPGLSGIAIRLYEPGSVEGKLLDANGQPLKGQKITFSLSNEDHILWPYETQSDQEGCFTINGLIPGEYKVAPVSMGKYRGALADAEVIVSSGQSVRGFQVVARGKGICISGKVFDEQGQPIAGAYVHIPGFSPVYDYTDDTGYYELSRLEPQKSYYIVVLHHGCANAFKYNAQPGVELNFHLKRKSN